MHVVLIILVPALTIVTLYRMWLNAQIYRIKYDFHKPIDPKAKDLSSEEINRMNESSLFILFCFFTFFWFKYKDGYRAFQVKSNYMMALSTILITVLTYSVVYYQSH